MTNYDSVIQQLTAAGLILDGGIDIGKMRRCKVEGDREKRGWYSLHEVVKTDGEAIIVGSYGVWQGNDNNAQKIKLEGRPLTPDQAEAIKKRLAEDRRRADAARAAEAERAATEAAAVWRQYTQGAGESDYLTRKGVKAHGVRWSPSGNGTFAVPMMDVGGKVWGLQIIRGKDRQPGKLEKEYFPRGLAKKGHYHTLGVIRDLVLIAEGYATAATLFEATGLPVVVAFDAGNLKPVAEAIKKAHKRTQILVCADDDYLTDGNPGCQAAQNAALAVGGAWVKPEFITDRAGKKLTDFNDLAILDGAEQVRLQIERAVAEKLQTRAPIAPARGVQPVGGGDVVLDGEYMPSRISIDDAALRYWGTYGLGGDVLFDEIERRLVHKKDVVNLLPRHGWDSLKDHPDWRVARDTQIGFDPTEKDAQIKCNLFGGWPTTPKAGTCTKLLELLEWLCANETNEREVYEWILKWLAYPLQHRGAKMHSAIVIHGPQGTGKSRFFEAYAKIYGPYGRVLGQEALEDKFNADWAEKKLFIVADEVLARTDMYHIKNRLKGFITGDTIRVNPKNVAAHNEKNQMNIVFLSNERMPLVLENDDRRHAVIWVPPKLPDDFFAAVNQEIDNGGIEALHHYLLDLDLGDFKPWTKPPMTKAKQDLIDMGTSSEERFLREWRQLELETKDGKTLPFCPCLGSDLYRFYDRWCSQHGERCRSMKDLISLAGKQPGWTAGHTEKIYRDMTESGMRESVSKKMIVPAQTDIELAYKNGSQGDRTTYMQQHDETKKLWLTRCFFKFESYAAELSV